MLSKQTKIQQSAIKSVASEDKKVSDHSYVLVEKKFLRSGEDLNFNLYSHPDPTHMSLFLQSHTVMNEVHQKKLREMEKVYVHRRQREKYDAFIEENLQNVLKDDSLTMDEKSEIIYSTSTELMDALYGDPEALGNAQRSKKIVTPILQSVLYEEDTIASYVKIINYDYYTHTHSLNVSVYSICLGAQLGLLEEELSLLGRSALLHDLGKSKIDANVVNKVGTLTQLEFQQMQNHSKYGYDIAIKLGIKNQKLLDGIRHHHEKLDGNGYPDGLSDERITLFPRIIGVCDVFDALTTKRSYKAAMRSYDALLMMKGNMAEHLDMKILNAFIKMLHK